MSFADRMWVQRLEIHMDFRFLFFSISKILFKTDYLKEKSVQNTKDQQKKLIHKNAY
jgi:hypothetical protein